VHAFRLNEAAFSPDGRYVATAARYAQLWEATTGRLVYTLHGGEGDAGVGVGPEVDEIGFSPDGTTIVSVGADIRLWKAKSGRLVAVLKQPGRFLPAVHFSPNGKLLVTEGGDYTARVWDVGTGNLRAQLGQSAYDAALRFSRDGRWVVTAGEDGAMRVWEAATGRLLMTFRGDGQPLHSVDLSDASNLVLTASDDGVRVFRCTACEPTARVVALARTRVTGLFSQSTLKRELGPA
jgi:WD40 repeat protein